MADIRTSARTWTERADAVLSSPTARLASVAVALIALILAGYVGVKQWETNRCLAVYADASARSTQARSDAAAQDRKADNADRVADEQDRQAFKVLVNAIAVQDQAASKTAFLALVNTYKTTDAERAATAKTRAATERQRAANPVPPPPSLKCG